MNLGVLAYPQAQEVLDALIDQGDHEKLFLTLQEHGFIDMARIPREFVAEMEALFKSLKPPGILTQAQGFQWLASRQVPEFLRSHYWRGFAKNTSPAGITFLEFLVALCAASPHTPHDGLWRRIRNNYIFSAFDMNYKDTLDPVEFRVMVSSIMRLSNQVGMFFIFLFLQVWWLIGVDELVFGI